MALLKDLWNFDSTNSPALFYGSFSSLNQFYDTSLATPELLRQIQIRQLKQAYQNKGTSYAVLNKFLQQMLGASQGTDNDLFAKLVNGINKGIDEFKSAANKSNQNWAKIDYYNELDDILQQINEAVDKISDSQGVPAPSLNAIKTAVGQHRYHDFIRAKGQYLEDLGSWIMERAGLTGLSTGSWQAIDRFFGEQAQSSLIEDAMGILLDGNAQWKNSRGNFLQVQVQNYNTATVANKQLLDKELQNWVNSIQELKGARVLNGKVTIGSEISSPQEFARLARLIEQHPAANVKLSVSLSENLYEQIRSLSVNIQAKSNVERHLANAGKRSLYHMSFQDKYYKQLAAFSKTEPVVQQTAVTSEEQNTPYEEFAAYVNYNLSKNINNTVYGRNEFYLTKEGFTDLATLMEKRSFCIRIKDSMLSYQQFLANKFRTIYE